MNKNDHIHLESIRQVEDSYFWHQLRFELVSILLKKIKTILPNNYKFFDLGSGNLGMVHYLKSHGYKHVVGVDQYENINETSDSYLKRNFQAPLNLPELADVIISMDVIEHLAGPDFFLQEINKSLNENGYLIITAPAWPHLFSNWDQALGHFRRYRLQTLSNHLAQNNFTVIYKSYVFLFLYPFALFRKLLSTLQKEIKSPEFPIFPGPINKFFYFLGTIELFFMKLSLCLPLGTSLVILAQKRKRH